MKTGHGASLSICNSIVTIINESVISWGYKWRSKPEELSDFFNTARFTHRSSSGTNGRCGRRRWRKSIQFAVNDDLIAVPNVVSIELLVWIEHFLRSILRLHFLKLWIHFNFFSIDTAIREYLILLLAAKWLRIRVCTLYCNYIVLWRTRLHASQDKDRSEGNAIHIATSGFLKDRPTLCKQYYSRSVNIEQNNSLGQRRKASFCWQEFSPYFPT